MDKVNLAEKFARIDEVYKPKLVAEYNDNKLILTRARGASSGTSTVIEPIGTTNTGDGAAGEMTAEPERI